MHYVGQLLRLYRDARSAKHTKKKCHRSRTGEKLDIWLLDLNFEALKKILGLPKIRANTKRREFSNGMHASYASTSNKKTKDSEININNPIPNLN